jgi:CRISPR-associated protein Csd2
MNNDKLTNRHDILLLFEVTNGNPNGDPDAGNMPRLEPNSSRGLVSDVCLKRKIRNFICDFEKDRQRDNSGNGYGIMVRQGAVLNREIAGALHAIAPGLPPKPAKKNRREVFDWEQKAAESAIKWMCREFYDVRAFGAVLSTGKEDKSEAGPEGEPGNSDKKGVNDLKGLLAGSAWGQVRGPVQFTFGQSYHPITPIEITVTRCAVTKEEDASKERTMGHKHIVPYGLYFAKAYVSPAFAERTSFTNADLALLFDALINLFTHDHSAARGDMIVRGIYDFEHVGTQHPNNGEQNKREARLGCAHAHVLFDGIEVRLKKRKNADGTETVLEAPQSILDYEIINHWDAADPGNKGKDGDGKEQDKSRELPKGVKLHLRHENPSRSVTATS